MLEKKDLSKSTASEAFDKLIKGEIFKGLMSSSKQSTEFITTGIPTGHAVNSVVDGTIVMNMPNAQVMGNQNVQMVYLNGTPVSYGYASPGNDVKVLEIFEGMLLVLVPVGSGAEGDGQWTIGYFETSVLGNSLGINANTVTWNDNSTKTVVDGNGNYIYSLPATQTIQFLYETPNNNYACILFNGSNGDLQTGYVPMSIGTFYRYDYLRSGSLQAPGIAHHIAPTPAPVKPIHPSSSGVAPSGSNLMPCVTKTGDILKVGELTLKLDELNYYTTNQNPYVYSDGFTENYVTVVKNLEGWRPHAYQDVEGNWTIGYGHLFVPGVPRNGYTFYENSFIGDTEGHNLLVKDLSVKAQIIKNDLAQDFPSLEFKPCQFDATLDLVYNGGSGCFSSSHNIFRDTLNKNYSGIQFGFEEWCHVKLNSNQATTGIAGFYPLFGLYKRRLEDYIMYTTGLYVNLPSTNLPVVEQLLDFTSVYSSTIQYA